MSAAAVKPTSVTCVLDRWYEIVGVVPDFPTTTTLDTERVKRVYHAAAFGDVYPAELAVRVRSHDAATFAGQLREISAAVDPNLQLRGVYTAEWVLTARAGLHAADRRHGDARDAERDRAVGGRHLRDDVLHRGAPAA